MRIQSRKDPRPIWAGEIYPRRPFHVYRRGNPDPGSAALRVPIASLSLAANTAARRQQCVPVPAFGGKTESSWLT